MCTYIYIHTYIYIYVYVYIYICVCTIIYMQVHKGVLMSNKHPLYTSKISREDYVQNYNFMSDHLRGQHDVAIKTYLAKI